MKHLLLLLPLLLAGCNIPKPSHPNQALRHEYFIECMKNAALIHGEQTTQFKYLGDMVSECSSAALYMSYPQQ